VPQAIGLLHKIVRRLEEYQTVRAADPRAAYNDIALAQDLWPSGEGTDGEAAAAPADQLDNEPSTTHLTAKNAKNAEKELH
jgi:hypothetical protein